MPDRLGQKAAVGVQDRDHPIGGGACGHGVRNHRSVRERVVAPACGKRWRSEASYSVEDECLCCHV